MVFHLSEIDLGLATDAPTSVTLVSEAAFHIDELIPIARALADRKIRPRLLLVEATPGVLRRLRSAHRRFVRSVAQASSHGFPSILGSFTSDALEPADALIVMNDWGPSSELVERAKANGGVTFGKIEGAQDFDDVDTGRSRHAYRSVDVVLCQGQNDFDAMAGAERHIVGNSRIEAALASPVRASNDGPIAINSNFSYGQLADDRRGWLQGAYDACDAVELSYRVSRHPADLGLIAPWKTTRIRIEQLIVDAPALVSRFSSVCFEALARGVPVAYFNPHGERAAPFSDPQGAFEILRTTDALTDYLRSVHALSAADVRSQATAFLAQQVDVGDQTSAERAADVIANRIDVER